MKIAFVVLFSVAQLPGAALRAGVARIDITPRGPVWMSGYASRNHPSVAVRQPLWARALAIEDGSGARTIIVASDLIGLPAEVADQVAARAHQQFGIERARLLLNSSHTHTGPVVWPGLAAMFTLPAGEEARLHDYASRLTGDLVTVIGQAIADLSPAQFSYGFGQAGFAMNRREPTATGIKIGVNPSGPTDHAVPVIKVAGPDGHLRAVLFAYACHNTTLNGDFYEVSGDYAGFAEARLEGELGQGDADNAVDSQGRALDAMKKGAQGLAQQMQQNGMGMGQGPGQPGRNGRARAQQDTDPLGRPMRGREYGDDVTVKVPGEIDAQRARRILEELRKRFGESGRPQLELDYIERLLKDF